MDRERINKEINILLPKYKKILSKLVSINSIYGKEREAQFFVRKKMKALGLKVYTFYSRDDLQSMNLVSLIKGYNRKKFKSLVLNAHCDVMPIDGMEGWTFQPFSGKIKNGVLYGRGAQDDKAGIVVILLIANILKNLNIKLKGDLNADCS